MQAAPHLVSLRLRTSLFKFGEESPGEVVEGTFAVLKGLHRSLRFLVISLQRLLWQRTFSVSTRLRCDKRSQTLDGLLDAGAIGMFDH